MTRIAPLAAVLLLCPPATAGPPLADTGLEAFAQKAPRCPDGVRWCFGIDLHLLVRDAGPCQTPSWVADQLQEANRHFGPAGVGFELSRVRKLSPKNAEIETRTQRDRLGRKRFRRGTIQVYLVARIANVDDPGDIRGVHWRDRAARHRRWVILSRIAPGYVLAHELGHYFGLPHSRYPISIMNKQPRSDPPFETWTFAAPELSRIRAHARRYGRAGKLARRNRRP